MSSRGGLGGPQGPDQPPDPSHPLTAGRCVWLSVPAQNMDMLPGGTRDGRMWVIAHYDPSHLGGYDYIEGMGIWALEPV